MPVYNLGQIREACYSRVDNNTALYPAPEVNAIINEALGVLNLFLGFAQATIQVPGFSLADQLIYPPPAGIVIPTRVEFEGVPLRQVSLKSLARTNPRFAREHSGNCGPPSRWVAFGMGMFLINPMDHDGGGDLRVSGIATPPVLANDADVIPVNDEQAESIIEYFAHRAPLKEGGAIFAASARLYQVFLHDMKQDAVHENLKLPAYWTKSLDKGAEE